MGLAPHPPTDEKDRDDAFGSLQQAAHRHREREGHDRSSDLCDAVCHGASSYQNSVADEDVLLLGLDKRRTASVAWTYPC